MDIESKLYNYAKSLDITLITVSHRTSLWKHHNFALKLTEQVNTILNPLENLLMGTTREQ